MPCINVSLPGVIDVPSRATWDDLVLPAQCIQRLHKYVLSVTHRDKVELEWLNQDSISRLDSDEVEQINRVAGDRLARLGYLQT